MKIYFGRLVKPLKVHYSNTKNEDAARRRTDTTTSHTKRTFDVETTQSFQDGKIKTDPKQHGSRS